MDQRPLKSGALYPAVSHTSEDTSITRTPPTQFHRLELDPRDTIFPSSQSSALAKRVMRWCCGIILGFVVVIVLFYVWLSLAMSSWRF
jgi:hypothetical protein